VKGYENFDELIKNHRLDFVIIAVPHYLHYEFTKKAILSRLWLLFKGGLIRFILLFSIDR